MGVEPRLTLFGFPPRIDSPLIDSVVIGEELLKDPVDSARLYLHGLASLHLGRHLPNQLVDGLLNRFPLCQIATGEAAFREGETGNSALLVIRGQLEATVRTPQGERTVGQAGPWDVVGETALYAPDRLRSATVRGRSDTTCIKLDTAFLSSGEETIIASLEAHLLHTLSHRIRVTNLNLQRRRSANDTPQSRLPPISPSIRAVDISTYAGILLSSHPCLDAKDTDLEAILHMGQNRTLQPGEILCAQGEDSNWLFFLLDGDIDIKHQGIEGESVLVGNESGPAILGHIGLIDRTQRGATCYAKNECQVIQLHAERFWKLMRNTEKTGVVLRRLLLSSLTRQLVDGNERIAGLTR